MQKQKRHGKLYQKDLSSLAEFKSWLKQSIGFYKFEDDVSDGDLLIYFDYIENEVRSSQENIDQIFWLRLIRELKEKLRVIKEV